MSDICQVTDLDREACWHCRPEPAPAPEPGIYYGYDEDDYHGDLTALSCSGAKTLCKARWPKQWWYDWTHPHRAEVNEVMEFGSAVHSLTLDVGAPVVEIFAETWNRKAEQELRKKHRAAGEIPLLTSKYRKAVAMADAVRLHPVIGPRLEASDREVSGWFIDPENKRTRRRFRIDALYTSPRSGVSLLMDVKTDETADPVDIAAAIRRFGYGQQDDWYVEGCAENDIDASMIFVAVARKPPHLVSINRVPAEFLALSRERNRRAIDTFARCSDADDWPDYGNGIHEYPQPAWVYREDHA